VTVREYLPGHESFARTYANGDFGYKMFAVIEEECHPKCYIDAKVGAAPSSKMGCCPGRGRCWLEVFHICRPRY